MYVWFSSFTLFKSNSGSNKTRTQLRSDINIRYFDWILLFEKFIWQFSGHRVAPLWCCPSHLFFSHSLSSPPPPPSSPSYARWDNWRLSLESERMVPSPEFKDARGIVKKIRIHVGMKPKKNRFCQILTRQCNGLKVVCDLFFSRHPPYFD